MESYKQLKSRYEDLTHQLSTPDLSSDTQKYQKIAKEHAGLKETVEKIDELEKTEKDLAGAKELLEDPEMKEQAKKEIANLTKQKQELKKELEYALLPKNPNDSKDVIMEIRAGAGGNEAGLFAADLFRMYSKYAEDKSWKINLINSNRTGIGGFKEVIFEVKGDDVFKKMKYESGVHRVQRVPKTEKSGRVHTSTATVAVFPEAKETDFKIDPQDIRIDVFRSSGPGGQSVNTTDSAVRVTHLPTNTVVSCQDEKSQIKNRERALKVLRSRLLAAEEERKAKEEASARKMQIGTGSRSEKIRTYNFPQDRMTDHRIKLTLKNLREILNGKLDPAISKLEEEDKKDLKSQI